MDGPTHRRGAGRPCIGDRTMSPAERQRKRYWKNKNLPEVDFLSNRGRGSDWLLANASRIARERGALQMGKRKRRRKTPTRGSGKKTYWHTTSI